MRAAACRRRRRSATGPRSATAPWSWARRGRSSRSGPRARYSHGTPGVAVERVRGVVLPGLVNAHTHLELSALRGQRPGGAGFVPWVEQLIGVRNELQPEERRGGRRARGGRAGGVRDRRGRRGHQLARRSANARAARVRRMRLPRGLRRRARSARWSDSRRCRGWSRSAVGTWPSARAVVRPLAAHALHHAPRRRSASSSARAPRSGASPSLHLAEHAAERRFLEQRRRAHRRLVRGAPAAATRPARVARRSPPSAYADEPRRARARRPGGAPHRRETRGARARRKARLAGRALPALEPLHRDPPAPAPRHARGRAHARAGHRLARLERLARRARRGARPGRPLPDGAGERSRRDGDLGRRAAPSVAATSDASRSGRAPVSSRSTANQAPIRAPSSFAMSARHVAGSLAEEIPS